MTIFPPFSVKSMNGEESRFPVKLLQLLHLQNISGNRNIQRHLMLKERCDITLNATLKKNISKGTFALYPGKFIIFYKINTFMFWKMMSKYIILCQDNRRYIQANTVLFYRWLAPCELKDAIRVIWHLLHILHISPLTQ